MSVDQLRKIVAEKELRSTKYRPCRAYWLLVVVDFMDRAQNQEIGTDRQNLANVGADAQSAEKKVGDSVFSQPLRIASSMGTRKRLGLPAGSKEW
jgi:hypothetical protein